MQLMRSERVQVFGERHQAIDLLRNQREPGGSLSICPAAVRALLQEIELLQVVAQAAEHVAGFGPGESGRELRALLRNALRRWKE